MEQPRAMETKSPDNPPRPGSSRPEQPPHLVPVPDQTVLPEPGADINAQDYRQPLQQAQHPSLTQYTVPQHVVQPGDNATTFPAESPYATGYRVALSLNRNGRHAKIFAEAFSHEYSKARNNGLTPEQSEIFATDFSGPYSLAFIAFVKENTRLLPAERLFPDAREYALNYLEHFEEEFRKEQLDISDKEARKKREQLNREARREQEKLRVLDEHAQEKQAIEASHAEKIARQDQNHAEILAKGIKEADQAGYNKGYAVGMAQGTQENYDRGHTDGFAEGHQKGMQDGFNDSVNKDYEAGISLGRNTAYRKSGLIALGTTSIIILFAWLNSQFF